MSTVQEQITGAEISTWQIDPNHSLVEFSAKHMMITTVKGRFGKVAGTITVDERNPDQSRVEAEIDAASIDTRADQRDQHLRSPDFLDVENYPNITFRSRRVQGTSKNPGDEFRVTGDLTSGDPPGRSPSMRCTTAWARTPGVGSGSASARPQRSTGAISD
jgi:polyisoprenoid-binding protein YceI